MNFFSRRRAFVLVQELPESENTKALLVSKLKFLIQQIKLTFDSVNKSELLTDEFAKNAIFLMDLQEKIANTLLHLVESSSLGWMFLQTLKVQDTRPYMLGNLNKNGFVLDTEYVCKKSENFFFDLLKLGVLEEKIWINLERLKSCSESIGFLFLNDSAYYEHKKMNILSPEDEIGEFEDINQEFANFVGRSLPLIVPKSIFVSLWTLTKKFNNGGKIISFLSSHNFQYETIRQNKHLLNISERQYFVFIETLNDLSSFNKLFQFAFEFQISGAISKPEIDLFQSFLEFFFCQQGTLFLTDNPDYEKYDFSEKILRASLWIDFLMLLCKNSINLFKASPFRNKVISNFSASCEIFLSPLMNKEAIQRMVMVDLSCFVFLMKKVEEIKQNFFYKKTFSRFLDKYLNLN